MSTDPDATLAAAQELLATLSAGRAALLQLASTYLPFDGVLALHRLLPAPEALPGSWDGAALLRERIARQVVSAPATAPTPAPALKMRSRAADEPAPSAPRPRKAERPVAPPAPVVAVAPAPVAIPSEPVAAVVPAPVAPEVVVAPPVEPGPQAEAVAERAVAQPVPTEPTNDFPALDLLPLPEPGLGPSVHIEEDPTLDEAPPPEPTRPAPVHVPPAAQTQSDDLLVEVGESVAFSGAGENTANWGMEPAATIQELLAAAPRPDDLTLIAPTPAFSLSPELSEWAANVLGGPNGGASHQGADVADAAIAAGEATGDAMAAPESTSEPLLEAEITPLASEPTANELAAPKVVLPPAGTDEPDARPMLREPRVMGASVATLDVRAAARGVAPRVAGADDIEVGAEDGDIGEEEEESPGEGGFAVTFEQNVSVRTRPKAPRLTDEGEDTNLTMAPTVSVPAIVVDDKQIQSLMDEASAHAKKGDLPKAIQAYTDALDMRPTLTEAHIGRGRCHLELGDYSSAMSDFARAEDLAPDKPESHVATGDLYFARKEYKRAIEFYDQAVEIDGSHAMARCRRGISHYYRKNYRQASQDLQRALALDPEIPNIKKYVQMAQKKLERGD